MRNAISIPLRAAVAAVLLLSAAQAWTQAHEKQEGPYIVRSSTVGSENLSEETARAQGIERSPDRAVINVTVMKKEGDAEVTVPAGVEVAARSLTGRLLAIPMKSTAVNGWFSYTGTYQFAHGEILDFIITALPAGATQPVTLKYRDRMWVNGQPVP